MIGPEDFAPGVTIVRNVTEPFLTRHGDGDGDDAVIVVPGGAYHFLAIEHEGHEVARRLVERLGVTAYVLAYRTVETPVDEEGFRAALAAIWTSGGGLDAVSERVLPSLREDGSWALADVRPRHRRVAMLGFSAGARLTVEALLSASPPDAAALVYPPPLPDLPVPSPPPPIITVMAADDPLTTVGAEALHRAWRAAGASSELHLFATGGHGFGTNRTGHAVDAWL
ncbi:MAG TPA: dienelactone hydrolase family protein, partial [Acidimicrobiales bacterium]|nr:dienelactone hydrolase family protein [Acidimicrobiales bacterium]